MDDSPLGDFGRLSPELRNEIYELCLTQPGTIKISPRLDFMANPSHLPRIYTVSLHASLELSNLSEVSSRTVALPRHAFALVKTCKGMRNECSKLIYSCNVFSIRLHQFFTRPYTSQEALWNGEEPNALEDTTLSACSRGTRQRVKQWLAAWRLFNVMIGQENAECLRSVSLKLAPFSNETGNVENARRMGGILATLSKEPALKKYLRMTVIIGFSGVTGPSIPNVVVNVGWGTTRSSLKSLAEEFKQTKWLASRFDAWEQAVAMLIVRGR